MSKLFIELTTGVARVDNSMGNNTKLFHPDYHTTFVRPHLIRVVQGKQLGDVTLSELIIEGSGYALTVAEHPVKILEMIEAIELVTTTNYNTIGSHTHSGINELRDAALGAG